MKPTDAWMPLYVGDYLAATSRLTTEEHGAYLLLIMDYWRNGPPPDDDRILAQVVRMAPDAWSIIQASIKQFFRAENGVLRHARIDKEKDEAIKKQATNTEKAKKAADARWNNTPSNAPSIPQAMPERCPSQSPSPSHLKDLKPLGAKAPTDEYSEDFEKAWAIYPSRLGGNPKKAAYSAWKVRLKEGVKAADMIAGVERYRRFQEVSGKLGTEFIQQGSRFFGPQKPYAEPWTPPATLPNAKTQTAAEPPKPKPFPRQFDPATLATVEDLERIKRQRGLT